MSDQPETSAGKILIADDEDYLRDMLGTALRFAGFETALAKDGYDAIKQSQAFGPDLVLLDVMMPGIDGLEVCRRMRDDGDDTPVIFLTALDEESDRIQGFVKGGDDYVTKPFSLEELIGRIRAVLRRTQGSAAPTSVISYGDLEIDEEAHQVRRGGDLIDLSPTEYKLLRYLALNSERVLSKSQILDHVWQYDFDGDGSVVESFVSYLRKKVDHGREPLIQTVRGVGYVIRTS